MELKHFLRRARLLGLRVIPLIQLIGHVEYILKHQRFSHLRHNGFHTEFDTGASRSLALGPLHPGRSVGIPRGGYVVSRRGDECFGLGDMNPKPAMQIFMRHMVRVLQYLKTRGKRPLIWDDMIRRFPATLRKSPLRTASILGLQRFERGSRSASLLFSALTQKVRRSRELLDLAQWQADFRVHAARRMQCLAGESSPASRRRLATESQRLWKRMCVVQQLFLEPAEQALEENSLFHGEETLLLK